MIIEKFQKIVEKYPDRLCVATTEQHITFDYLNRLSNRVTSVISRQDAPTVGLLLSKGEGMMAAMLGALKAGNTYVPLDASYPEHRLAYMLKHSQASLLLTDESNGPLCEALVRLTGDKNISIINIDDVDISDLDENINRRSFSDRCAYILYTSGSTGTPKGVMQTYGNVCRIIGEWILRFDISCQDRLTLLPAYSHDASVMDIYSGLLSGASLFPLDVRDLDTIEDLPEWIAKEQITVWHSVPTLFRYFTGAMSENVTLTGLRLVLLGGEAVIRRDIELFDHWFPGSTLQVIYGQSESSLNSTWSFRAGDRRSRITLGTSVRDTELFLVEENGDIVEDLGAGEIFVCSPHVAAGYWRDEETTRKVFLHDPELGLLYRTGDLGRMRSDGSIEFLGRKDFQVKIRGFRVELGEIESSLLSHEAVKEAAVTAPALESGEIRLAAFVVTTSEVMDGSTSDLEELLLGFLETRLPGYMIPASITKIEAMPLTPTGKTDRRALTALGSVGEKVREFVSPADELERNLVRIWADVLDISPETISVHKSFLQLGGHSLKAGQLTAAIHRELDVKVPLRQVFDTPTIHGLAMYIRGSQANTFRSMEAFEKRDYYPLSPAQQRLLVMQRMDPECSHYNMPQFMPLNHVPDLERLNRTFGQLIRRHESLRTAFVQVDDQPVQQVHSSIEFKVSLHPPLLSAEESDPGLMAVMEEFVRPFDLECAPLLRAELVPIAGGGAMVMVDLHHIIADGNSLSLLQREFMALYNDGQLAPLALQYRDYSLWQGRQRDGTGTWSQENFWLDQFSESIPQLELPMDFAGEKPGDFVGSVLRFSVDEPQLQRLRFLASKNGVTMSMLLFALYNVLLTRICGQEDLVVGMPVAGRSHSDLESIIGMFVNLLPLRTSPSFSKSFNDYLSEVRQRSLFALENQDYQFEELVQRLGLSGRDTDNPLVSTVFVYAYEDADAGDITPGQSDLVNRVAKFALTLGAAETRNRLFFDFEYRTCLFKEDTIVRMKRHFLAIIEAVLNDPSRHLAAIELESRENNSGEAPVLEAEFGF